MNRRRLYLQLQLGGWAFHALVNLLFAAMSTHITLPIAVGCIWGDTCAGFASHFYRGYIRRHNWLDLSVARAIPRVFLASLLLGAAITAVSFIPWAIFAATHTAPSIIWVALLPAFFVWSVVIFLWSTIYFGVHYFESLQSAEVEKLRLAVIAKDAQMNALLAQVNPHFIFNCLNSLRALIDENPERARTMVDQLASVLRHSLQAGRAETVSLDSEMEAVRAYLQLESIRFEERLLVSIYTAPETLGARLPPMIVQSLVENGIKHGIATLPQGGEVRIVTAAGDHRLTVRVFNSGHLKETPGASGIGVANIRERLRLLYGASASLSLANDGLSGVVAELSLPL